MQNIPATPEQLKCIQQLLFQHPELGQGVRDMAHSIASYDGKSAVRYLNLAIATRHLSPLNTKEKTASHLAIAC
jgi:hypothetical protein